MRTQRSPLLALALALACAALADAATPSVCAYNEGGILAGEWSAYCGPNPEWLATQTGYTPLAKYSLASAKAAAACAKYNVTAGQPADIQKCLADKANFCSLDGTPGNWVCNSNSQGLFAGVPCAGSPYGVYVGCLAKYESDCSGACAWRPDLQRNYTRYQELRKLTGNAYGTTGYCMPASINYIKTYSDFTAWFNTLSPSDPKEFVKQRGTCQYAKDGQARFAYDDLCQSFNDAKALGLGVMTGSFKGDVPTFTGVNASAATRCLVAGCMLDYIPGYATFGYGVGLDFFQCGTNPVQRYALGYYSPTLDKNLLDSVRVCSDQSVRYNKARCLAAAI